MSYKDLLEWAKFGIETEIKRTEEMLDHARRNGDEKNVLWYEGYSLPRLYAELEEVCG